MAILSLDGRPVPGDLARAQLNAIAHRGEWEPRLWEAPGIALGHVHLPRTPEAEREVLPATDSSERYWITWDGRLDNRAELASLIQLDSERARQMTDADYVLAAYTKWQDECVHHLLGDWAVVIWDSKERRLFCAKDPLGWRQLYYAEHDCLLFVGSEPQQLFAGGVVERVANLDAMLRMLGNALQEPGSTFYEGVSELPGAQTVSFTADGQRASTTYWIPPADQHNRHRDAEDYVDEFEHLMVFATEARLRSNRPVASFVSGGLDSSYVTAVAARIDPQVQAFTLFAPDTEYLDERNYARVVAERCGISLTEVDISDCWHLSSKWLPDECFDQPYVPGAGASLRKLASAAADTGVGVVLGGEGGDEWIRGVWYGSPYRNISSALSARQWRTACRLARTCRDGRGVPARLVAGVVELISPKLATYALARNHAYRWQNEFSPWVTSKPDWRSAESLNHPENWTIARGIAATFEQLRSVLSPEAAWRDRHVFSSNHVEPRSPIYDLRVVEMLCRTPEWVKNYTGKERSLLRTALHRTNLSEIAERKTKGTYVELNRIGLSDKERTRLSCSIKCVSETLGIVPENVNAEIVDWIDNDYEARQSVYRIGTSGIWLHQLDGCGAPSGGALLPAKTSWRKEVIRT